MTPELKKCLDNLMIEAVMLKNLSVQLHDDVEAEQFGDEHLSNSQELKFIKKIVAIKEENSDVWIYRLSTVIALRCVSEDDLDKESGDASIEPLLEVKAEFNAQYHSSCELSENEINQFAEKHVYFHVWPYWRELLQSTCARLGIRPIVINPLRV